MSGFFLLTASPAGRRGRAFLQPTGRNLSRKWLWTDSRPSMPVGRSEQMRIENGREKPKNSLSTRRRDLMNATEHVRDRRD